MKLTRNFYLRKDVVQIAKELLGKYLYTKQIGIITGGIITETEAYKGITDKASHSYGNRRTARTEIMYRQGGTAYIYLCYGIHSLFNVVTNMEGIPDAVLIRSIEPAERIDVMLKRRNITKSGKAFTIGPGTVSQALGIHYSHTGIDLLGEKIWIEDKQLNIAPDNIIAGQRIGVAYAAEDALLPYRFQIKNRQSLCQQVLSC